LRDLTNADLETKQQIFRQNIRLVEIETHARCNRVCSFCPNSIVDRRKNKETASFEMLERLFAQLGSIDYAGQIKIARYSEPLANLDYLYACLASARRLVPRAQLAVVTNTDYLKREILNQLERLGLNVLFMSIYLKPGEKWSLELAREYNRHLAQKLGLTLEKSTKNDFSLICLYRHPSMTLRSSCMNFDTYGNDRGETLNQYALSPRQSPCREPFETFVVDFNGSVMPCCNLRSDFPQHQKMIAGDLSQDTSSIFDIYAGKLAGWRRSMVGFDAKTSPCSTCSHRAAPESLLPDLSEHMQERMKAIGAEVYFKPLNSQ
jgi:MoaA/NifB/PqqE/SkfB family radical SAM enzyme